MQANPSNRAWQAVIYQDEDGAWCAEVPALPGCVSSGETREEAISSIREAIELWLEAQRETGRLIPSPNRDVEVVKIPA